ncbi:MAG: alpha-E domain-containing protein [Spartobacteria bacterium]
MLRSNLDFASIVSIFQTGLHQYLEETQIRLNGISNTLAETYCRWL